MIVRVIDRAGEFAEDKDTASEIRKMEIEPALKSEQEVTLDFGGVSGTTQSFVHALLSNTLRTQGEQVLDRLVFRNCADGVKTVIYTVIDYSLAIEG